MRIIHGYQDTRENKEDFALTPFLFSVCANKTISKLYGIGICWGYFAYFIGVAFNIPKDYPSFHKLTKQ